ncbi:MAG: NUMOD4 domain-containing protein, partial [Lactococcus sp.]|nr:NUMOD4 domain-containing protein [Lactococcus sp.]
MENYNIKKEIWEDVEGFEGLYQVSDRGRVKSLNGVVGYGDRHHTIREKIKKGTI